VPRFTVAACAICTLVLALPARADTTLNVFISSTLRPEVMRQAFDHFEAANPGIKVKAQLGGATSDLQAQYLNTVMSAKDSTLDVLLLDIIRPAQFAATGWTVPLNQAVGNASTFMQQYLPAYAEADTVDGKLVALPAFADAMVLYYRRDLLDKYHLPVPKTWSQLAQEAKVIQAGEQTPDLQGVSFQGAPIEGTVCTFLLPYWSMGKMLVKNGHLTWDNDAALKSFALWTGLVQQGVAPRNVAEIPTDQTRKDFEAGKAVFAVLWSFGWNLFQSADSAVKDKVGVAELPAVDGGKHVSCIGGWQWGVSAYSRHEADAVKLVKFLSSPDVSRLLAEKASLLPVFPKLYHDPELLKAVPWMGAALPVVEAAKSRPVTPRYNDVSDVIRTQTNAVLAGSESPQDAAAQMQARLRRVLH
jgi:multiple sugar transport system substrate-binding protein